MNFNSEIVYYFLSDMTSKYLEQRIQEMGEEEMKTALAELKELKIMKLGRDGELFVDRQRALEAIFA